MDGCSLIKFSEWAWIEEVEWTEGLGWKVIENLSGSMSAQSLIK